MHKPTKVHVVYHHHLNKHERGVPPIRHVPYQQNKNTVWGG